MRKFILFSLLLITSLVTIGQKTSDRLFLNIGTGPSYSLYYNSGGWVRDFGPSNVNNITQQRTAWAFSHFGEIEWRLKNQRWSLRGGYSMHHFFPSFKIQGVTPNNTIFVIDTKEPDRYTYFQVTTHYAFFQSSRLRIEAGTGFYIQENRRQGITYHESLSGPVGLGPTFLVNDYQSQEAGFPLNIDCIWSLKNNNGIGARFNMNYTQSVQTFEHLAFQLFFKGKLN